MTETPMVAEINCETGEQTLRPQTPEELAQSIEVGERMAVLEAARKAERDAIAVAKASATEKLIALGLTDQEIASLSE